MPAGLTQDEQQLLRSAQSEDRDEAASLPVDNVVDRVAKAGLALLPLLMDVGTVGGLLGRSSRGHHLTVSKVFSQQFRLNQMSTTSRNTVCLPLQLTS